MYRTQKLPAKILRFAVMVNDRRLTAWQIRCLEILAQQKNIELSLFIRNQPSEQKSTASKRTLLFRIFRRFFWTPKAAVKSDIPQAMETVPEIACKIINKGRFSQYFSEADVDKIKSYNLDFILRFGFGIIRGDVLNAARFGIWSFHHGDEMQFRGSPAGFWEVYHQVDVSGVILQRITDRLDGGIVLRKGFFQTRRSSYKQNLQQLLWESAVWPAQVCRDIQAGISDFTNAEPSKTKATIYYTPNEWQVIQSIFYMTRRFFFEYYQRLFMKMAWNVGIIDASIEKYTDSPESFDVQWLTPMPNDSFIADPCALSNGGSSQLLVERFYYRTNKGVLEWLNINPQGEIENRGEPFKLSCHASYPFLLKDDAQIYMLPETHENHELVLYRCDKYPDIWQKKSVILSGESILDATVFKHNGLWWLFATKKETGSNLCLHLWFSEKLTGPWQPHNNNPVKTDIRASRPAGPLFYKNGDLFRPAQDCSKNYGAAITVNQVTKLNQYEYEEHAVSYILPDKNGLYPDGVHTVCAFGEKTVIDGKRHEYSIITFIFKLKSIVLRFLNVN